MINYCTYIHTHIHNDFKKKKQTNKKRTGKALSN